MLPHTLQEIGEALHDAEQLEKLVRNFGGTTLRIPAQKFPDDKNALVQIMGKRAVRKLMAHFGGTLLYIPQCRRIFIRQKHCAIIREYQQHTANGSSGFAAEQRLARKYALSDRWIRTLVNRPAPSAS